MASKEVVTIGVTRLFVLRNQAAGVDVFAAWTDALADLTDEQVERGLRLAASQCGRWAMPADVIRLAGEDVAERASEAWGKALQRFRSNDCDQPPENERTMAQLGGWHRLGDITNAKDLGFLRREFLEAYPIASRALERQREQLPGGKAGGLIAGVAKKLESKQ